MSIEAMKAALDALEFDGFTPEDATHRGYCEKAITALRQAITEAEQADKFCDNNCVWTNHHRDCDKAEQAQPVAY